MSKGTKIIGGYDIGNGYEKGKSLVKGSAAEIITDIPSAAAYVTGSHDIKVSADRIPEVIGDIFNNLDASFDSPIIKMSNSRRFFGKRGISSGLSIEEFDVTSHLSKTKQDLSGELVLATIAGTALQNYYNEHNALPTDILTVSAGIALALPISEFKKYREEYASRFKSAKHLVMIHNFETPIRVEITFVDVQVLAEGAAAQYALQNSADETITAMLDDCRRLNPDFNKDGSITAIDVKNAKTVVGVDIGEGTVNFPVYQNGQFNTDISFSFEKGYGSILVRALERLVDEGMPFTSRKALADYLQAGPNKITQGTYNRVKAVVEDEAVSFVNEVNMQFTKILNRIGAYLEVVYVYGGGASPIQTLLQPVLVNTAKNFNGEYPILYLDSRYSRNLNREGLYIIATMMDNLSSQTK